MLEALGLIQKGSWDDRPGTMGQEEQVQTASFTKGHDGLICRKGLRSQVHGSHGEGRTSKGWPMAE